MAIFGIDHVNIGTDRLEETLTFYRDVLGFSEGWRPDFPYGGAWLYAQGRPVVHLRQLAEAKAPTEDAALDHVAFEIDDFEAVVRRLDAAEVTYRCQDVAGSPVRQILIRDLNGVNIELNCARLPPAGVPA